MHAGAGTGAATAGLDPPTTGRRRRSPSNGGGVAVAALRVPLRGTAPVANQGWNGINVANAVAAIALAAAAAAAHDGIGQWQPLQIGARAPLSLANAAHTLALRSGTVGAIQHSNFFVPFLRAAQGLPDVRIQFLRDILIGEDTWDAAVTRTAAVFAAAGITPAFTMWNENNYLGEHGQLALLGLEARLLTHWPTVPAAVAVPGVDPLTGGTVLIQLVGQRIAEAIYVVANPPALP